MLLSSLRTRLFFLFLLLIFACLGGIAGFNISSYLFSEKYGDDFELDYVVQAAKWRMLPKPPERIKRLITARPYTVYAETEMGHIIGCFKASKYDVNCWFAVESIAPIPEYLKYPCGQGSLEQTEQITPQLIKLIYCDASWREPATSEFVYVLKSDGSVWQWEHDLAGLADTPNLNHIVWGIKPIYLLVGCSVGTSVPLFAGIVLFMVLRHTRKIENRD